MLVEQSHTRYSQAGLKPRRARDDLLDLARIAR
jgi:hypothetical protein